MRGEWVVVPYLYTLSKILETGLCTKNTIKVSTLLFYSSASPFAFHLWYFNFTNELQDRFSVFVYIIKAKDMYRTCFIRTEIMQSIYLCIIFSSWKLKIFEWVRIFVFYLSTKEREGYVQQQNIQKKFYVFSLKRHLIICWF